MLIPDIPAGFTESTTTALGQKVYSVNSASVGDQPPLVMIHGALVSHRYLMPVAELMIDDYQVFVPDLPGHGRSSKPEHAVAVAQQADIIHAWLLASGITRCHFLSNSYGCTIVVEIAARYPELCDRLILTSPTADPSIPTKFTQALKLFADAPGENPILGLVLAKDMIDLTWHRAMETTQFMIDYDYKANLPKIRSKALVVRGEHDTLVSPEWAQEVTALIPNAKLDVIAGAPHDVNFTTPQELARISKEFLASPS